MLLSLAHIYTKRKRRKRPQINGFSAIKERKNPRSYERGFLAGAVGLEPTTNGFGVAQKVRNPLKILDFCKDFQSIKTQNAML